MVEDHEEEKAAETGEVVHWASEHFVTQEEEDAAK